MLDKAELDKLYTTYGFRIKDEPTSVRVYLYEKGRYFGADIVPFSNIDRAREIKDEYSELGYASKVREYDTVNDAEVELYKSFFSFTTTSAKLKTRYQNFVEKQTKSNGGGRYEYINSRFEHNNKQPTNGSIISHVDHLINNSRPQLIILEAAAGYGKTCTAYEILNFLVNKNDVENPILTELSRNRGAKIFRYILLDEIDREYPSLNSELVKYEIQSGRIPLIIDGFDELLDKSDIVKSDKDEVFGEVESMLDTIGSLLAGKAKIILTTRKTAIFAGAEFDKWFQKWENTFDVNRFSISEPRIKDWLGSDKLSIIRQANIPVGYIANPVLLTYLRNLPLVQFKLHAEEPEQLVQKYFHSLLEREMERQDLLIRPEDQLTIFSKVVHMMIELDCAVEARSFMKEIIYEQNKDLIQKALELYPASKKPTIENLVDKLANHALLDRKGYSEDTIGFINDFVFGTFIGEIMVESHVLEIEKKFSAYMVEIGATAYRVQNDLNKEALWQKVESLKHKFENQSILNFDITLKGEIVRSFHESIFQSITAFDIEFSMDYPLEDCVFINCKFKGCRFDPEAFHGSSFIDCHFDKCTVMDEGLLDDGKDTYAIKCTQEDCSILSSYKPSVEEDEFEAIENKVLAVIWQNDSKYRSHKFTKLMAQFDKSEHKKISKILERLENNEMISIHGQNIYISINKTKEVSNRIKSLLE